MCMPPPEVTFSDPFGIDGPSPTRRKTTEPVKVFRLFFGEYIYDGARVNISVRRDGTIRMGCHQTDVDTLRELVKRWDEAFPPSPAEVVIQSASRPRK